MSSKIFFCGEEEKCRENEMLNCFEADRESLLIQLEAVNSNMQIKENTSSKSRTSASSNSENSNSYYDRNQAFFSTSRMIYTQDKCTPILNMIYNQNFEPGYQMCEPNLNSSTFSNSVKNWPEYHQQSSTPEKKYSIDYLNHQSIYNRILSSYSPDLKMQAQFYSYYCPNLQYACRYDEPLSKLINCTQNQPGNSFIKDHRSLIDLDKSIYESIEDFIINCKCPINFINSLKGSRHIQKLILENEDKAKILCQYVQPIFGHLLINVYGNYVCKKIFSLIKENQRQNVWNYLTDNLLEYSENQHANFCVQMLITRSDSDIEKNMIEQKLAPYFHRLASSEHGVNVMLALLSILSFQTKPAILEFLIGNFPELCLSSYSSLLCRALISKSMNIEFKSRTIILRSILPDIHSLILNEFSSLLLIQMLEVWGLSQCAPIIQHLFTNFIIYSLNPISCPLIMKLLELLEIDVS